MTVYVCKVTQMIHTVSPTNRPVKGPANFHIGTISDSYMRIATTKLFYKIPIFLIQTGDGTGDGATAQFSSLLP